MFALSRSHRSTASVPEPVDSHSLHRLPKMDSVSSTRAVCCHRGTAGHFSGQLDFSPLRLDLIGLRLANSRTRTFLQSASSGHTAHDGLFCIVAVFCYVLILYIKLCTPPTSLLFPSYHINHPIRYEYNTLTERARLPVLPSIPNSSRQQATCQPNTAAPPSSTAPCLPRAHPPRTLAMLLATALLTVSGTDCRLPLARDVFRSNRVVSDLTSVQLDEANSFRASGFIEQRIRVNRQAVTVVVENHKSRTK